MHHHHHHTTTGWDRSGGPGRSGFAQVPQHDATIDDWNAAHDAGFDNEVDDRQEQEQQQQQEQEARQQAGQGQEHQQGLWERFTRDGFASVPQSDVNGGGVDGHHHQAEEQPQPPSQRSSSNTKDQFRDTIQQLFRKSAAWYDPDDSSLEEGSPALTDDTLVGDGEGYLDLPIQRFEEVDIGLHENFAEYHGYYGPEVTVCLSPSKSTRAGKGLEVRVEEIPYNGPTDGCFIDKQYGDTAYRGSEGLLEKQSPTDLRQKNYKPLVLRGRFLLILLTALATLLGLAVFALLALPDASQNDVSIDSYQNITEIRRRSILLSNRDMIHGTTSSNKRQIAVDSGASVTSSPADQVSTTAAQSSVASTALPESAPTTDVPPSTQAPTTQVVQTPETSIESVPSTTSTTSVEIPSSPSSTISPVSPTTPEHTPTQQLSTTHPQSSTSAPSTQESTTLLPTSTTQPEATVVPTTTHEAQTTPTTPVAPPTTTREIPTTPTTQAAPPTQTQLTTSATKPVDTEVSTTTHHEHTSTPTNASPPPEDTPHPGTSVTTTAPSPVTSTSVPQDATSATDGGGPPTPSTTHEMTSVVETSKPNVDTTTPPMNGNPPTTSTQDTSTTTTDKPQPTSKTHATPPDHDTTPPGQGQGETPTGGPQPTSNTGLTTPVQNSSPDGTHTTQTTELAGTSDSTAAGSSPTTESQGSGTWPGNGGSSHTGHPGSTMPWSLTSPLPGQTTTSEVGHPVTTLPGHEEPGHTTQTEDQTTQTEDHTTHTEDHTTQTEDGHPATTLPGHQEPSHTTQLTASTPHNSPTWGQSTGHPDTSHGAQPTSTTVIGTTSPSGSSPTGPAPTGTSPTVPFPTGSSTTAPSPTGPSPTGPSPTGPSAGSSTTQWTGPSNGPPPTKASDTGSGSGPTTTGTVDHTELPGTDSSGTFTTRPGGSTATSSEGMSAGTSPTRVVVGSSATQILVGTTSNQSIAVPSTAASNVETGLPQDAGTTSAGNVEASTHEEGGHAITTENDATTATEDGVNAKPTTTAVGIAASSLLSDTTESNTVPTSVAAAHDQPPQTLAPSSTQPAETLDPITTFTTDKPPPTPSPSSFTTTMTTSTTDDNGVTFVETRTSSGIGHLKAVESLTDYATTYTGTDGKPTTLTLPAYGSMVTEIETDAAGVPTATAFKVILYRSKKTTMTDVQGLATATLDYYLVLESTTSYDSDGHPTATLTSTVAETAVTNTLYNNQHIATKTETILDPIPTSTSTAWLSLPTPTAHANANTPQQQAQQLQLSALPAATYAAGLLLPTLLATLVAVPIRVLDRTVKLYQPFHALASPTGATAEQSLLLETVGARSFFLLGGGGGPGGLAQLLLRGDGEFYVPALTSLLVLASALLVPLSAEAFRVTLLGPDCHSGGGTVTTCDVAIGVAPAPAHAVLALLAFLLAGGAAVALLLRRWATGLAHPRNPWSLAHVASLTAHDDTRRYPESLLRRGGQGNAPITRKHTRDLLRGKVFALAPWEENGRWKYGILALPGRRGSGEATTTKKHVGFAADAANRRGCGGLMMMMMGRKKDQQQQQQQKQHMPFFILTGRGRLLFLAVLAAALVAVLTYDRLVAPPHGDAFDERRGQAPVGVRFGFAAAGVVIAFLWEYYFTAVAFLSPHRQIAAKRVFARSATEVPPPSTAFGGLLRFALAPRGTTATTTRDGYLACVSAAAVLADALPLVLQLVGTAAACAWLAAALLAAMMLTVGAASLVAWPPRLLVDPSTLLGAMYYACAAVLGRSVTGGVLLGVGKPFR